MEFNPSYIGPRYDILRMVPREVERVLDVGCSVGATGENLKRRQRAEVIGIELDEKMATLASSRLDKVIVGDIERLSLADYLEPTYFDCIVLGDILEHLREPWDVLQRLADYLARNGVVIASIPNVRHYTTILTLAGGYWPYRHRGIHDRTHLRFFTLRNIRELFSSGGLEITRIERNYRFIESGHRVDRLARYFARWPIKEFLAFQYLVMARLSDRPPCKTGHEGS